MRVKVCSCGNVFYKIPLKTVAWIDQGKLLGQLFDCEKCKTTLFIKEENLVFYEREKDETCKNATEG